MRIEPSGEAAPPVPAPGAPRVARLQLAHVRQWLAYGWLTYRRAPLASSAFAALFALIGFGGLVALSQFGLTPLIYPWAGGFMLVGPALLCGYFELADHLDRGEAVRGALLWQGFHRSPPALWVLGVLSVFLLMIWLTDAAIIYGLYFGREPVFLDWALLGNPQRRDELWTYFVFCTVVGAVLALIVFAITAFAVPLLYFQRLPLTIAVGRSVRGVFANLPVMVVWGSLLTLAIVGAIVLFLPAFVVLFPLFAYASAAAYRDFAGHV